MDRSFTERRKADKSGATIHLKYIGCFAQPFFCVQTGVHNEKERYSQRKQKKGEKYGNQKIVGTFWAVHIKT